MLLLAALEAERPSYVVPTGCPPAAGFWDEVRARSLVVGSSTATLDVRVTVTASSAGYAGSVRVAGGAPRALHAGACEDLMRGLALVTAMLVDAEPPPSGPESPVAVAADRPAPRARTPSAPAVQGLQLAVGVGAALGLGHVPGAALVVPIFAELHWPGGPSLRAALRRAAGEAAPLPGGVVAYAWTAGRVELCPAELDLGLGVVVACGQVEGGLLAAEPRDLRDATPSRDAWLAVGAAVRARAEVVAPLFVEAGVAVSVPVLRSRYLLVPAYEVYTTPSVAADVELAAGVRFW